VSSYQLPKVISRIFFQKKKRVSVSSRYADFAAFIHSVLLKHSLGAFKNIKIYQKIQAAENQHCLLLAQNAKNLVAPHKDVVHPDV